MSRFTPSRLIFSYNHPLKLLRIWRRNIKTSTQLVPGLDLLPVIIARYSAQQLLLNLKGMPPMSQEVEHWVMTTWIPRLRQSGIRRLALLLPADSYNMRVIEGFLWASATQVLPYEIQYFSELPAALDWMTDAELPTTEQDWSRHWRGPVMPRAQRLRWCRTTQPE